MRPMTRELLECAALDEVPGLACRVDFGIMPPGEVEKFGAYQWAIRHEMVTPQELNEALGDGAKLTEIVNRGANPYGGQTITTSWDGLKEEFEDEETDDEEPAF